MKLQKDNGKDIIILTDDEIIIKGIFKDRVLKRDNILSACLLESVGGSKGIVILTKDYKIVEKRSINMKWSDREKLKLIVDEINTEGILFNYRDSNDIVWLYTISIYIPLIMSSRLFDTYYGKYFAFAIYLILIFMIIFYYRIFNNFDGVIYDSNKEEFKAIGKNRKVKEKFTINDIELDKKFKDDRFRFRVKESGYKFYIRNNTISYPTEYEKLKDTIKSTALKSQLKNSH